MGAINGSVTELSACEIAAIECLKLSVAIVTKVSNNFAEELLSQKASKHESYGNMKWVPPTSNRAERLFSRAKQIITPGSKRVTPIHLEENGFLLLNKDSWDLTTVCKIV